MAEIESLATLQVKNKACKCTIDDLEFVLDLIPEQKLIPINSSLLGNYSRIHAALTSVSIHSVIGSSSQYRTSLRQHKRETKDCDIPGRTTPNHSPRSTSDSCGLGGPGGGIVAGVTTSIPVTSPLCLSRTEPAITAAKAIIVGTEPAVSTLFLWRHRTTSFSVTHCGDVRSDSMLAQLVTYSARN